MIFAEETTREMGKFRHFMFALLASFALIHLVHAQYNQLGFISIDCGLPANSSYSEKTTGINYISDETFIDSGISKSIATEFKSGLQQQIWNVRSFPQGNRNCYTINVAGGTKYLIRATFLYGNYDGQKSLPGFDLYFGTTFWQSVKMDNISDSIITELIHVPDQNYIHVCLVNTGHGTPFISAIELRPLKNNTYVTQSGSLALFARFNVGPTSATNPSYYRFPYDAYDRLWGPYSQIEWTELSTSLTIDSQTNTPYNLPSVVMSTASTPTNNNASMDFFWKLDDPSSPCYVYMHFAELQKLAANQSRSFNVSINGRLWFGPLAPKSLVTDTIYSTSGITEAKYSFSISKTETSTLPPILNAIEIYTAIDLSQSETDKKDVDAITKIKSTYGVKRVWQGDPCAPQGYPWDGLNCSFTGSDPPRITSLNLSSSGLTGDISADISNLVMLQYLDLSNNSLTGAVPDFLSQLPYLTVLNLEQNQLNGSVPVSLIERSKNGSLSLSVGGNTNLCSSLSCHTKKSNNIVVPIVASLGGLFILALTVGAFLFVLLSKRKTPQVAMVYTESNVNPSLTLDSRQRQYTFSDVVKMTNNFERTLGKGGFGKVYHGFIDDDSQVAVKMLSPSAVQGYQQFQAEVQLLVRVHHKNLTRLVGYCNEGTNIGLIYEYMANGNLDAHLSDGSANTLSWEHRLRIAVDTAQGLEYLHNGCKPPIVHRDVKSTNILLNEHFQAKLADFGLSKIFPTDGGTHVSTMVAGTPGYLDPEYFTTNRLTEKSDIFSFGVVILELITSRPAIARIHENTHISQWVSFMLGKGDIKTIVDQRLRGQFDNTSVWKAIELALLCVSAISTKRPTMSQVVVELKECLDMELARTKEGRKTESSVEMFSVTLSTEFSPSAR